MPGRDLRVEGSRSGTLGVIRLGCLTGLRLIGPSLVGVAVDRMLGTAPWALVAGTLAGVLLATYGITSTILSRYAQLAPPGSEEEQR